MLCVLYTVTHFSLALIFLISRSALNSTQFVMHISTGDMHVCVRYRQWLPRLFDGSTVTTDKESGTHRAVTTERQRTVTIERQRTVTIERQRTVTTEELPREKMRGPRIGLGDRSWRR
jgi:hypothetical protein